MVKKLIKNSILFGLLYQRYWFIAYFDPSIYIYRNTWSHSAKRLLRTSSNKYIISKHPNRPSNKMAKMVYMLSVLALFFVTSTSATPDLHPSLFIHPKSGCSLQEIIDSTKCICFVTSLLIVPTDPDIRDRCEMVTGTPVEESQAACDPFLIDNDTNYDFPAILASATTTKECFFGSLKYILFYILFYLKKFPLLFQKLQLFVLLESLCELIEAETGTTIRTEGRFLDWKVKLASLPKKVQ